MALLAPNGLAIGPVPAFIQLFVLIRIFKYKYKQKTSLNESARYHNNLPSRKNARTAIQGRFAGKCPSAATMN
jgi:polyferredoxin